MKSISKIIALLCAFALMTAMVTWAGATESAAAVEAPIEAVETADGITPFEDISPEDYPTLSPWAQKEIIALYSKGAVPDALMSHFTTAITRAEFTAIIVSAYEAITGEGAEATENAFGDIAANPYAAYISKAFTLGIIDGRSDTVFDPDANIKRQEAAKILYSFASVLGRANALESVQLDYADVSDISDWAMPYVCYAYAYGLMQGTGTSFDPLGSLTREQSMAIIQRLWIGSNDVEASTAEPDPVYRALAIGISDYAGDKDDGERFDVAVTEYDQYFRQLEINGGSYTVTSASNMLGTQMFSLISSTFAEADDDDVSVFMLSSHGGENGSSFGANIDFDKAKYVLSDGSVNEAHAFSSLVDAMRPIRGVKVLLIGSCFSGGMAMMATDDNSMLILTASAADEESHGIIYASETFNVFERAVLKGLGFDGSFLADYDGDGAVTFDELAKYVKYDVAHAVSGAESDVQIKSGVNVVLATGIVG